MIRRAGRGLRPAAWAPHVRSHGDAAAQRQGAGGGRISGNGLTLSSAELYDPGLGFDPSWQPLLTNVSPLNRAEGSELTASGSRFKGISEASGGNGSQNSSSNYPLVQLLSLTNEQTLFLPVDAMTGWSDTSFTSTPITLMTTSSSGFPDWLRAGDCLHQRHPQSIAICAGCPCTFRRVHSMP